MKLPDSTYLIILSSILLCTSACSNDQNDDNGNPPLTTAFNNTAVTYSSGDIIKNGSTVTSGDFTGSNVAINDDIITGRTSSIILQISDYAAVRLMSDSRIRIDSDNSGSPTLTLVNGELLVKVIKLPKDRSFRIKSGNMSAVVRGTSFRVFNGEHAATVSVSEGKVAVYPSGNEQDPSQAIITEPGFTVQVSTTDTKLESLLRRSTIIEENEALRVNAIPILPENEIRNTRALNAVKIRVHEADNQINKESKLINSIDKKRSVIIRRNAGSLAEIKDAFNRIDEITLYNKRTLSGIIISRGSTYGIITPDGRKMIDEKDILIIRIIK